MAYAIALLPGDGIGPEVVSEARRVLERVVVLGGGEVDLEFEMFDVGAGAWQRTGEAISDDTRRRRRDRLRHRPRERRGRVRGSPWRQRRGRRVAPERRSARGRDDVVLSHGEAVQSRTSWHSHRP